MGHTHFTHSYLLAGERPPMCIWCHSPLTVEHIIIDYVDFALSRSKYFNVRSLQELFATVQTRDLIDFIKDVGLYKRNLILVYTILITISIYKCFYLSIYSSKTCYVIHFVCNSHMSLFALVLRYCIELLTNLVIIFNVNSSRFTSHYLVYVRQ